MKRAAGFSLLLAGFLALAGSPSPPVGAQATGQPVLAVEDTFLMPTTTLPEYLVEAPRVSLDEILRRVVAGEARRDSLMRDASYTVHFKVVYGGGDGAPKVAREVGARVYKKRPDKVRAVKLRDEGDEAFEFDVAPSMGEQYVSFAFQPESRARYEFEILERLWLGGHVVYRIAYRPRSKVDLLPTGEAWVDTNEFVIVRQEFAYENGSPLPLFLKSFSDCVVERSRVDGGFWVWTRFFVRVETTSALRFGGRVSGHPFGEVVDLSYARTEWEVNRGLPDSLFAQVEK